MKIVIETIEADDHDIRETKDSIVGLGRASIQVSGAPGEKVPLEKVAIVLAQFFGSMANKFLDTHPCKDCSTYVLLNSMVRHMEKAERDVMRAQGIDDLLNKVDKEKEGL